MMTAALTNILGHDSRGSPSHADGSLERAWNVGPPELVSHEMEEWNVLCKRLRARTLGGGGGNVKTYQPGELLLPVNPRPGLRSGHQAFLHEMSSKAVSSSSQLKAAVPAQRASVEE